MRGRAGGVYLACAVLVDQLPAGMAYGVDRRNESQGRESENGAARLTEPASQQAERCECEGEPGKRKESLGSLLMRVYWLLAGEHIFDGLFLSFPRFERDEGAREQCKRKGNDSTPGESRGNASTKRENRTEYGERKQEGQNDWEMNDRWMQWLWYHPELLMIATNG